MSARSLTPSQHFVAITMRLTTQHPDFALVFDTLVRPAPF